MIFGRDEIVLTWDWDLDKRPNANRVIKNLFIMDKFVLVVFKFLLNLYFKIWMKKNATNLMAIIIAELAMLWTFYIGIN